MINRIKACFAILRGYSVMVGFEVEEASLKARHPYFYNNKIGDKTKCNGIPLIESIKLFN